MKQITLRGTGLKVSELCLGTDRFGAVTGRDDAFAILDAFRDHGGCFVDTANIYARDGKCSLSETLLGEYLASRGKSSLVVATKGGHPNIPTMHTPRLSPSEIEHDLDESLQSLGLDCIELYYLHRDDISQPIEEIMGTLDRLAEKGKIRYYGASNYRSDRIERAAKYAAEGHSQGFSALSNMWSPASQNDGHPLSGDDTLVRFEDADLALFGSCNISFIPYSSGAKGWFSKHAAGQAGRLDEIYDNTRNRAILEELQSSGKPVQTALFEYIIDRYPMQIIPITSVRNIEQLADVLAVHG